MRPKWMKSEEATSAEQPGTTGGTSVPVGEGADSDVNWDSLDKEITAMDAGEDAPTPSEPPAATPAAATPPVEPVAPVVAAPPVQPVASVPAPPAAPVTTEAPAAPTPPQPSAQELRGQYLQQLEAGYGLSDDDARAMLTEPEKVLPKLAAQVHANVVDTVIAAVMQNLPNAIQHIQRTTQTHSEAENSFFQAWPGLKDNKYRQTVYSSVAAYRQLNPTAPMDEVIRAAGLNAMITLRMPIPQELLGQPEQPAAPPQGSFTPASPSRGMGGPTPNQTDNPFVALSQEFLELDR